MAYKKINEDIKSGAIDKAAPVLLCGEEYYLVDFYEKALGVLFSGGSEAGDKLTSDIDVSVFYGEEATDEAVIGALETFPMLSSHRVVVVRGYPDLSAKKDNAGSAGQGGSGGSSGGGEKARTKTKSELAEYMGMIPDTARLIFSSAEIGKKEALYKAIGKFGTIYELNRLGEEDLRKFIQKRLNEMKVTITADVLNAFILATGYLEKDSDCDLFNVKNDLYKAASFALSENRGSVTLSDIEKCMPGLQKTYVYDMLDAISAGRKAEAISILENKLAEGTSVFGLLALITSQFEIMLGCKELLENGRSAGETAKILGERLEWKVNKLGRYARQFTAEKLKETLLKLYETESNIKSGDIDEGLALTLLFAEI